MVNGIGRAQKLSKQNMQLIGFTNGTLNTTSPTSHTHDKSNRNIDVGSKESITEDTYYCPRNDAIQTMDDLIQTKPPIQPTHHKNDG